MEDDGLQDILRSCSQEPMEMEPVVSAVFVVFFYVYCILHSLGRWDGNRVINSLDTHLENRLVETTFWYGTVWYEKTLSDHVHTISLCTSMWVSLRVVNRHGFSSYFKPETTGVLPASGRIYVFQIGIVSPQQQAQEDTGVTVWDFNKFNKGGLPPARWMVCFRENPKQKWRMTGGTPMT